MGVQLDRAEGMREGASVSADAALVEVARRSPAAFYQLCLSPAGTYAIPVASPAFATRFGIEPGEPEETAARFFSRIHPDDLDPVREAIARSAKSLDTFECELRFRDAAGAKIWVEVRSNPERTADGCVVWNGIAHDITARVRAEEALRASEEEFRAMFDIAPVGIAQADPATGRWLAVNPRMCLITGYRADELLGMRVPDITHPEDRDRDWELFQNVVKGEAPEYRIEKRYVRKDGSIAWVNVNMVVLPDAVGRPARTLAMIEDISERKNAEEGLRASEERFRAMFDVAPVGVAQADPATGRFLAVNPRMTLITGYSTEELLGMRVAEITHPEDLEQDRKMFQSLVGGEADEYRIEKRHVRKDGAIAWVNVNVVMLRDAAGRPNRTLATIEDITERKTAAEALVASESRYHVLFENAAEGIVAIDPETRRFLFHNPAVCAMFGYTPDEFSRLELSDLHPKEALADILAGIKSIGRGERRGVEAVPCVRKGGSTFQADVRGSGVELEGRRVVFGFFTDITERVRLEEQLRQAQKMEAIGQLAGGVAHDFNNLLTVISGNCDLLLSDSPAADPRRGSLADIRSASERAASLTRQLLAFSRKQILEPRILDVHEVVTGVENMLRRLIGEDVDLLTDLAANRSWVKVDPGQLEQVVMNLVVNARDAMPRGGRITIRTRNVDPADSPGLEETAEQQPRPRVAISISDTGSGIPPEVKAHLFEPFFTTKAVGRGTGLGLATVYGIVKQSGGDITVESEPGKGATFTVVLPSQPAPPRPHGSSGPQGALPRGTETVLVVEDEDAVRRIVKVVLESTGYRVIEARSGPEALKAVREHAGGIQIVVTDVVMPEMSGRELAERIAKDHPGVRILYMSGYTDDAVMRHGIVESGVAFLQKPFSPLALARKVREALDVGR